MSSWELTGRIREGMKKKRGGTEGVVLTAVVASGRHSTSSDIPKWNVAWEGRWTLEATLREDGYIKQIRIHRPALSQPIVWIRV